jgi:branched-chain amino acid transport system substrate-binding protein
MTPLRTLALVALLVVEGCSTSTSAGTTPDGPEIEIASEFPIRGGYSFPDVDRAVDIAIAEHPTVEGYRLVHLTLDDSLGGAWSIDRALQNMRKAAGDSAIAAMVGPWTSEQATVLIPLAAQADLAVLSPSNTLDCLTDRSSPCLANPRPPNAPTNYFRVAARDALDAKAAADLAVGKLGASRFAVFGDPFSPPYGETMADDFAKEVAKLGGKVVDKRDFFPGDQTFAPLLRDARDAGAQAIYISTTADQACGMREQMAGIFPSDAYLITGDRLTDPGCIQVANLVGETDQHFLATIATGEPKAIPADLKPLSNERTYEIYTFSAYDCARILIDAIGRAIRANGGKIPTREQVRAAVAATANFRGLTGTYSFDAYGDVANPSFSFYTINHGNWAFSRNP